MKVFLDSTTNELKETFDVFGIFAIEIRLDAAFEKIDKYLLELIRNKEVILVMPETVEKKQ